MKLLTAGTAKSVQFEYSAEPGSQVFVAGTFNNWNPTANRLRDNPGSGHCKTTLAIPAGTEYKFIVNGVWTVDPNCADWTLNDCGSLNSVRHV